MTDADQKTAETADTAGAPDPATYAMRRMNAAWQEPERASARASAEPMPMYVDPGRRAARCCTTTTSTVTLLTMDDILFVNKHHDVEQASKFLGSNRPAIPLGLDGPEHRKYRRLLDPVFTAKRVAPLADSPRRWPTS